MDSEKPEAVEAAPVPATPTHVGTWGMQWARYMSVLLGLRGRGAALIGGLAVLAWVSSGLYMVQPDEQGVVMRFGHWVDTTGPGLHYHWPFPVETALFPKVTQINQMPLGSQSVSGGSGTGDFNDRQMLTGDENIVEADCSVLWRIKDAGEFLFHIKDPETVLKMSAESALREIISRTPIQAAMSDKRQQIAEQTRDLLQSLLDEQHSGILVTQVQLQRVDPPAAVIDAFNDVQRARADQERARNEAEAYANDVIPRARGDAARIAQEAQAYSAQTVQLAEGDARSFESVYSSYAKAKNVTAWRLYLESVDAVLKKASKVIIDTSGKGVSGVMPYFPLSDKDKAAKEGGK